MYKSNVAWEAPKGYAPTGGAPTSWIVQFARGTINAVLTTEEASNGYYYSREQGVTTLNTDTVRQHAMRYWGNFFLRHGSERNISNYPNDPDYKLLFNAYLRYEMEGNNQFCPLPFMAKMRYRLSHIMDPISTNQRNQKENHHYA